MAWEMKRHTWPLDGEDDEDLQAWPVDAASVLSPCSSYGSMPSLEEVSTGEVHDEPEFNGNGYSYDVWEDKTRGDGDTTRGDGDAEDTGESTGTGHGGRISMVGVGGYFTRNWIRNSCDAYSVQRSGRGYNDIIHGGGSTMICQPTDTNMHEQLRKRYNALTVPLVENHAATRCRWSVNSVTHSCEERGRNKLPRLELMFRSDGKKSNSSSGI